MPTSTMFTPVDTFLFACRVCFGVAAFAEDYFGVEFGAVPDFPGFGAFRELTLLLWFLLVVLHVGVLCLPADASLLAGFYLSCDAVVVCSAYLV